MRSCRSLFNLVDNAVKYANGANASEIVLRCRREGGGLQLTVRDHGPGVPARHLRRIFEPFYRGENELTRRSKGTGLGLALVRGLAQGWAPASAGATSPKAASRSSSPFPRRPTSPP